MGPRAIGLVVDLVKGPARLGDFGLGVRVRGSKRIFGKIHYLRNLRGYRAMLIFSSVTSKIVLVSGCDWEAVSMRTWLRMCS